MRLTFDDGRSRLYQSDIDPAHITEVRSETRGFFRVIERATFESRDPADQARVETVYGVILRRDLAIWLAEHEELDLIGEPRRVTSLEIYKEIEVEGGLRVPAIALMLEQTYWPPAPEEPT